MREMSVSQFKATCLARFDEIAKGGEGIIITRRGVPIAQIGPVDVASVRRRNLGRLAGTIRIHADIVAPMAVRDMEQEMLDEWAELHR